MLADFRAQAADLLVKLDAAVKNRNQKGEWAKRQLKTPAQPIIAPRSLVSKLPAVTVLQFITVSVRNV
jgi:hypothetical protein